mmetsp:Transcript_11984/g.11865  ORF Transcript_11984/g.11865 Transcript_11984/m.11865 type:complete len:86 (-) Transcript_11984:429-686(-)
MKSPLISRDNNIVFINHGNAIRNPSERKTPPPPMWGEDENEGYDPKEPFYDISKDPTIRRREPVQMRNYNKQTQNDYFHSGPMKS